MKRTALMLALTAALCFSGCASDEKKDDEIVIPIYKAENISYNTETAEIGEITQRYYIDGGFGYPEIPYEMNDISDLQKLAGILERRGYSGEDVENIFHKNWQRILERALK